LKVIVLILDGARAGHRFNFDSPRSLRFGRHPDNDVAFDANLDRDASSRHAELRLVGARYQLFDLGSANGTIVDGAIIGTDGVFIDHPVEVRFGAAGPTCRIEVVDARADPPPTTIRDQAPHDDANARATPAAPAGRRFGAGTVAGIVDEALKRARTSGRRQGVTIALVVAVSAATLGAAAAIILRSRPAAMKRELAELVGAQTGANDADRARLQQKIDELAQRLGRGKEIPKANHGAVFLVVSRGASGPDGFCTAFAATKNRLLTNAHCVQLADELRRKGNRIEVVPNGGGRARAIVAMKKSSGFHASSSRIGADVGWLEVEGELTDLVKLAPKEAAEAVAVGDSMSTYGFPGRLADTGAPEATYVAGVIGRITTLEGRPGSPAEEQLLQHSAFTSAGTSGSPLFDAEGRVIGINAGGYLDDGPTARPLPGYNFGMRIDLAYGLLEADE
jgi:V8-like Glu-specific endopeptidase